MSFNPSFGIDRAAAVTRGAMDRVYLWMTAGLLLTGAVAVGVANSPELQALIFGNGVILIGLIVAQFGIVIGLTWLIQRISAPVATALFLLYAALTGLTLSSVFLAYTSASVATTFFVTAGAFAGLSAFGYLTKRDLSGIGRFLVMALIGLLLATVANFFLRNSGLTLVLTYLGVLIFAGLTAYDTQRIKTMMADVQGEEGIQRMAIYGALTLYLDFINLFLYLLRILGDRR